MSIILIILQVPICNVDYLSILAFSQNFFVIHGTDYFTANLCYVSFLCICHCFYSCQIIAVLQLRFCFI